MRRRSRFLFAFVASLAALLMLGTALASAATIYRSAGSFTEELNPFASYEQYGMAVDDATGQILIAEGERVNVYAETGGGAPTFITSFGAGTLSAANSIAIDQSSGAIYIADAGSARIVRYTSDHAANPTFTEDASYVSPPAGSGPGEIGDLSSPMAIDPRNGDLLVADRGNHVVSRFSSSGTFLGAFNGSDSMAGTFINPASIAVDGAGEIYVVDVIRSPIPNGASVVEPFTPAGVADGALMPMDETPSAVTFDSESGDVLVVGRNARATPQPVQLLYSFHAGSVVATLGFPADVATQFAVSIAADGNTGRVYALIRPFSFLESRVEIFDPLTAPTVSIGATTDVTTTQATLHGTIDPVGITASYHFEYSDDGGSAFVSTPEVSVGITAGAVEQTVADLEPNQTYVVRLVGTNTNGSLTTFNTQSFSTIRAVPSLTTGVAVGVDEHSATLLGTVDPHGLQTVYRFEYGETDAYGQQVPVDHADVAGGRHGSQIVQESITGLKGGTTYHYRLVATNSVGTAYGADRVFTTSSAVSKRVYELVSPVDKEGANVYVEFMQASPDGNVIGYTWKSAPGGEQTALSSPKFPHSVATRGADGWTSVLTDPPQTPASAKEKQTVLVNTFAVSSDGSHAVVSSRKALAPGAIEGGTNIYLRDNASGTYTTMLSATNPSFNTIMQGIQSSPYVDGTPDFSHVLFGGEAFALRPGDPSGALYDWSEGRLRLVSIDQNGVPFGDVTAGTSVQLQYRETPFISEDGRVVAIPQSYGGGMYVRVGDTTYAASASRASADPGTIHDATYAGMSTDGHYVFFYSHDLTDDSEPGVTSLYRFDVQNQALDLLTAVGKPDGWLQTSGNGQSVYFITDRDLAAGSTAGALNIDVWHQGVVHHIATLDPTVSESGLNDLMASPNGRYFAFTSYSNLTGYDNTSKTACVDFPNNDPRANEPLGTACREVYRYDVETETLTCASCRPDGGPVTGNATLGENLTVDIGGHHFPRAMLDDGTVIFDTPDSLVPNDTNSKRDVYSFDGSRVNLISSGKGPGESRIADVSADGRDVFFTTEDQLVPADTDELTDLYDARIGGGIAWQQSTSQAAPCKGEACQGLVTLPLAAPDVGSGVAKAQGQRGKDARSTISGIQKLSSKELATLARGGKARLRLKVSGGGTVTVAGTAKIGGRNLRVTSASVDAKRAGVVSVLFALSRKALTALGRTSSLKVLLTVRYKDARVRKVSISLRSSADGKGGRS